MKKKKSQQKIRRKYLRDVLDRTIAIENYHTRFIVHIGAVRKTKKILHIEMGISQTDHHKLHIISADGRLVEIFRGIASAAIQNENGSRN